MATTRRSLRWAGLLIGLALGGFFDGILLHQILQWHHLLSNVDAVRDMRMQLLADGIFHALMYVIAAIGLALLWRGRHALAEAGTGRRLSATALLGFGAWHIVDGVLSHWVTGIHRIKVDSPTPLVWDLLWFVGFGVLPAVVGWWLLRGTGTRDGGSGRRAAAALGLSAVVAGPFAALPTAADPTQVVVLFAPGVSSGQAFNALAAVDARVVWVDRFGGLWAVRLDDPNRAWRLYRSGAMLVSNTAFSLGCISAMTTGGGR